MQTRKSGVIKPPGYREGAPRGPSPPCAVRRGQRRPALPRPSAAVPSAMEGLASGFGMGPGGPPPPWPLTAPGGARLRAPARALRAAWRARRTPVWERAGPSAADACGAFAKSRARPISTARLSASRRLQLRPICSWSTSGLTVRGTHLGDGFPLRCLQRLSVPDAAGRLCRWSTTGAPEVRPPRSSRTGGGSPQIPCACGG